MLGFGGGEMKKDIRDLVVPEKVRVIYNGHSETFEEAIEQSLTYSDLELISTEYEVKTGKRTLFFERIEGSPLVERPNEPR